MKTVSETHRTQAEERKAARDARSDVDQLDALFRRSAKVPAYTMKDIRTLDVNSLDGHGYCRESIRLVKRILKNLPQEKIEEPKEKTKKTK